MTDATETAPTRRSLRSPSRRLMAIVVAAVVALGGGAVVVGVTSADASAPTRSGSAATVEQTPSIEKGAAGGIQDPVTPAPVNARTQATATRVQIPSIEVDSTLEQLPLDGAGTLTPPVDFMLAGWYRDGTVPGDVGPAVIAGHVDSVTAPAVFSRLGELVAGDKITVTLSTGATKVFEVDSSLTTPKNAFPTQQVYGPTPTAQLRLITCDGAFDRTTGHYVDNLVVSARLVP